MRKLAAIFVYSLMFAASLAPAHAQMLNFMLDVFSTAGRFNRIEPGGAVSRSIPAFEDFLKGIRREAAEAGISAATIERAFNGLTPDMWVLEKANHQPEFVRPIWEYLDSAVSERRIVLGREALAQHAYVLDAIEATYNIDRHVVVAIWGMESTYGHLLTNPKLVRPVIRSLASLAYLDTRRSKYARSQLLVALSIMDREKMAPEQMIGSWAGAMGHTQFIPATYMSHAVDFDGDGRRDIWNNVADALGSTANYLTHSGWRPGETWGYEVGLPARFDFGLVGQSMSISDWRARGVQRTGGQQFPRPGDEARLYLPAGANGPAFLLLQNFAVIKRYNNSDAYALAVGHLTDRLRGGAAFAANWPVNERILGKGEREELQRLLTRLGFDTGGVDGRIGPRTEGALRAWQASVGLIPDGFATGNLLDRLRRDS